ncbi:MAG: hypothetical protein KDD44_10665 [Bdellovibrionales bacterium]|nr:hypothetical protein [Bdellovibrionales bacterium]
MSEIIWLGITWLILGGISTAVVLIVSKRMSGGSAKGLEDEIRAAEKQIDSVNASLERAFEYAGPMVPYQEVVDRRAQIAEHQETLKQKREALAKLERNLQEQQEAVDIKEGKHNELKMGKEQSEKVVDELKSNKERLLDEAKTLEERIQQSKAQLDSLVGGMTLSPEQQIGMDEINRSLDSSRTHLKELMQVHERAAQRFVDLEAQYTQLESEYRNLVEKQLGGED